MSIAELPVYVYSIHFHPYNEYMEEQNENQAAQERKTEGKNRTREILGFILRLGRLAVFGSTIIYTGIATLPEGILPSLGAFHIALIAVGGTMVMGLIVFVALLPGKQSIVSGSFDLEAMAAVIIGMLTILALSVISLFASENKPSNILFWLLLVGVYTFYVFMIIKRGLSLQNENEELKQKYGELLELDQEKTDFVTVTSHQLRTPLNEIKWILGYAIGQEMSDAARQALQKGLFATNRIVGIVNSILRARTLDLRDGALERKEIDLGEAISKIVEDEKEFAREKETALIYNQPESPIILHGAEEELGMAIENVIDNAIRYAPRGSVTVVLQAGHGSAQIRIEDTGIGISTEDRDRIFRKFYRAQNALLAQPDGTGIGLYITKKIIEKHGGNVSFASELGKGTKFLITLPLNQK